MLAELLTNNRHILQKTNSYLLPHLDKIVDLTRQLEQTAGADYFESFTRRKVSKGTYLLCEGAVCRHLWFLEKGLARVFIRTGGDEVIRYFFFPGEPADAHASSSTLIPSAEYIQVISDSVVYSLPLQRFEELKREYPLLAEIDRLVAESYVTWLEQRHYRLLSLNASKHYRYLLCAQPLLLCNIPLTYIASYLGISLETLSRIRAKAPSEAHLEIVS